MTGMQCNAMHLLEVYMLHLTPLGQHVAARSFARCTAQDNWSPLAPACSDWVWLNLSAAFMQGFGELPQHCGQMMIGFFCLSLAMSLLRDLVPTRFSVFIPIPMAMAIPFYVGASVAIDICIGALIKAYWYWTSPLDAPGKVGDSGKPLWTHGEDCTLAH